MNSDELLTWANECAETHKGEGVREWRDAIERLLAERDRLAAERDHHEQQQRLLLYRDMPKLREERDAMLKAKCDAQARVAELERELAELRAACEPFTLIASDNPDLADERAIRPVDWVDHMRPIPIEPRMDTARKLAALLARTPTAVATPPV